MDQLPRDDRNATIKKESIGLTQAGALEAIGHILRDQSKPMKQRFRALFTLKGIGGNAAIELIVKPLLDNDEPSALLKHELAYCLGQMGEVSAIPALVAVLCDAQQQPIVRHEAGEALGAIGSSDVLLILEKYQHDLVTEVAETCQLAIQRIQQLKLKREKGELMFTSSIYDTVDPALPLESPLLANVCSLRTILLDDERLLYERYGAMFSLRNIGNDHAIQALGEGLFVGGTLFRHEVAFVLGQLQNKSSVPQLIKSLRDVSENEMVRHECAEALGSIATPECREILKVYLEDPARVVKESCAVALDMCDYENDSVAFQYADGLQNMALAITVPNGATPIKVWALSLSVS